MRPQEREYFKRTIFISLPAEKEIIDFVQSNLTVKITETYSRLKPICYLDFNQIDKFTDKIFHEIAFSNAIIAFIKDLNNNVLLEIGRAMALGKPYIPVAPRGTKLPSLVNHNLTIFYDGEKPNSIAVDQIIKAINEAVIRPTIREGNRSRMDTQINLLSGKKSVTRTLQDRLTNKEIEAGVDAFRSAENEYRNGNIMACLKILDTCLKNGFKTEEIFHLKADCYFLLGEGASTQYDADTYYDMFLNTAQKGLDDFPGSTALRKDRGNALVKGGHYTNATEIFNQLLLESREPVYLYNLACINSLTSNKIESLRYLEQAILQEPYYQTLARMDTDFDNMWFNEMFQALIFQKSVKK